MKRCLFALFASCALLWQPAHADRAQYRKPVRLSAQAADLYVEHQHDWSTPEHLAFIRAVKVDSSKELFSNSSPALTYLWISPDAQYIVGLSNIKLQNQYQLIVLTRGGEQLLAADLTKLDWAKQRESVSNWIRWYKEPSPVIEIDEARRAVKVEDLNGEMRTFYFR
ncbi:MAG TPA: hypothetical protein VGF27_03815 [Pseudoduganella sp.]